MTHDEQLEIVIRAINNTVPKDESPGLYYIDLYQNAHKELAQFDELELFSLIKDLIEYNFSIVLSNSPLGSSDALLEKLNEPPTNYFELILREYPLNINCFKELDTSLEELYYPAFLALYDLLLDIEEKYESTDSITFQISLIPKIMKIPEAYENMAKREIMSAREQAINLLVQHKIIRVAGYQNSEDPLKTKANIILCKKLFKRYKNQAKAIYLKTTTINNELQKINSDEEIAFWVIYTPAREIIVKGHDTSFQLAKLNFIGENDMVFTYLDKHPNIKIDKKTLVQVCGGNLTKTLPKIVEKLGFTGNLLRAFINVNETTIYYRNSITQKQLHDLGINKLLPPKNKFK